MRSAELTPIRYEALSAPVEPSRTRQDKKKTNCPFQLNAQSQLLTFSAVCLGLLLSLLLLELHIAKVHDGANDLVAAVLLIRQEAQDVHGVLGGRGKNKGHCLTGSTCWLRLNLQLCGKVLTSVAISS